MEYKIISSWTSLDGLEEMVQDEINKGWRPLGGFTSFEISGVGGGRCYHQAMILEVE